MHQFLTSILALALLLCGSSCRTCGTPKHKTGLMLRPNAGFLKVEDYPKLKQLAFQIDLDPGECKVTRLRAWIVEGDACDEAAKSKDPFLDREPHADGQNFFSKPDNYEATLAALEVDQLLLIEVACEDGSGETATLDYWGSLDKWKCVKLFACPKKEQHELQ